MRKSNRVRRALRVAPNFNKLLSGDSRVGPPASEQAGIGDKKIVEVDFRQLADGTLVEMIADPEDSSKSLLAICKDGQIRYAAELEYGNQIIRPLAKTNGIIRNVRLPEGAEDYSSAKDLWIEIRKLLWWTLDLSAEHEFLLAAFVMSTCFIEKLSVAPYVAFVGLPGTGKTTALRVLDLVCRRSVLTADISSAAFYEICDRMTPTF
jgi:hypothetical protein